MRTIRWLPAPELAAAATVIAVAIAACWGASLDASFQFDDWNVIVGDPRVQSLAAWWHALPDIRPLLKLTYALNHALGAGPSGFRLFNLAVHGLNAVLVFVLIRRRAAGFVALACASTFALEPVQTEAVTYVCGRSSALAALPCLGAIWCWDRAAVHPAGGRPPTSVAALHALGLLCFVAALAVKETAAALPLALWLWQATTRPDLTGEPSRWNPLHWPKAERRALAGYIAVAMAALIVALASPTYRHLLAFSLSTRSIPANLALQSHAWGFLAAELVRLSALHADAGVTAFATTPLGACAWAAPWVVLIGVAWALRARAPALAFGVGWFVIWLLPTNSFLPRLDPANDRQLYLALIGPAWLVALVLARVCRARPVYGWLLIALLAAVLGSATAQRNRVYATEISYWQAVLSRSPADARAANNLGIAYALDCRDADAARAFARAIALDPTGYRARVNLAFLRDGTLTRRDAAGCHLAVR